MTELVHAPGTTIAVGRKAKVSVGGEKICVARATPKSTREIVSNTDNVICGDLDPPIWRAQKGRQIVAWSLAIDITWPIMSRLFPLFGLTDTSGVFTAGATDEVTEFPLQLDLVGDVHNIPGAFTSRWAIRGSKGSKPVQLTWDIVGIAENTGSYGGTTIETGKEFAFTHSSITMEDDGTVDRNREFDRFVIQIDNGLVVEHANNTEITDVTIGDRKIIMATSVPYVPAEKDLYFSYRDDEDGRNSVIVLDNDEKVITFGMPKGLSIPKSAAIGGKAEQLRTPVTMMLFRDIDTGVRIPPITITPTDPA